MKKQYRTAYTDERLHREDNVRNRDGDMLCKFRGIESNEAYYFSPEFVEAHMVEVAA